MTVGLKSMQRVGIPDFHLYGACGPYLSLRGVVERLVWVFFVLVDPLLQVSQSLYTVYFYTIQDLVWGAGLEGK